MGRRVSFLGKDATERGKKTDSSVPEAEDERTGARRVVGHDDAETEQEGGREDESGWYLSNGSLSWGCTQQENFFWGRDFRHFGTEPWRLLLWTSPPLFAARIRARVMQTLARSSPSPARPPATRYRLSATNSPSGPSVFVSCRKGKEKQCVAELYNLFHHVCTTSLSLLYYINLFWPYSSPTSSGRQKNILTPTIF